jgi:hypothetical protein
MGADHQRAGHQSRVALDDPRYSLTVDNADHSRRLALGHEFAVPRLHLPRLKNLDGLHIRFLAPAAGFALGQRTASHPFGVAAGRDALGPEVTWRVRGEVNHDAVRVDVAHAATLVHLAGAIGGLELDAHDYSVMK